MNNDWPTQSEDLEAASDIINHYVDLNDGEPLGLIEVVIDRSKKKAVEVRVSEWIQELIHFFRKQYGQKKGQIVATKVITRVLLKDETIH